MKLQEIGVFHSCFKEKFGTPRQSGLSPSAYGTIAIRCPFSREEMFKGLHTFSHIWVIFGFHSLKSSSFKTTVRPPRLGGNKKVGVFATRSPYRPNPLGLSLLKLEAIRIEKGEALLHVSGQDILDQTPIFDIKPYLPKVDIRLQANSGWTENICGPEKTEVTFSEAAMQELQNFNISKREEKKLIDLIQEILHLDPRPGHQQKKNGTRKYSFKLLNYDVHWEKTDLGFRVQQIELLQI